ncbi:MAG: hypothetical protein A3G24_25145 [Betaproteobacteria bacterium RIFCSPLOWO2_12_FULL_62_13]|nr:MAG: hypothetical protein A3G24_25145 [Betaproteobacteria bacterium RIFCSPLOWO2_12_FULL_62_13]
MELGERFRNLLAIPSHHYHPVFGREVVRSVASFKPEAIAVEISAAWAGEIEWGASLWPAPVVSYANHRFLPMVPGDSIMEGCRLGKQFGIPVIFVDIELADPIKRPKPDLLPDAALAPRVGNLFLQAADALEASAGPPAEGDVMREAHMSARLAQLMKQYQRVLWIGGMAHWPRMRERLQANAFDAPSLTEARPPRSFKRMRLASSALHRMAYRLPFQVAHYASAPACYDEAECLRELALAAVGPEKHAPIGVASMLLYARNLEAQENISEAPGLWPLLTAASSCLGNPYASRLAALALRNRFASQSARYPLLTYRIAKRGEGSFTGAYRCEGKTLEGEPIWAHRGGYLEYRRLPSSVEIGRRGRDDPVAAVKSAGRKANKAWAAHPDEERAYEAYVRHVLQHLSSPRSREATPVRFASGMGDGVDVRATIRHWHEGEIYVREREPAAVSPRNGLIDYTGRSEDSWILPRARRGGWVDPDLQNVGSASWTDRDRQVLREHPFHVSRIFRELSLITLDAPTWERSDESRSFHSKVIAPMMELPACENNLCGWLRIMFRFCRNKPFGYWSHYRPGLRVLAIAREFGVRIVHIPLERIPWRIRERHRSFEFMYLTHQQYDELLRNIAESRGVWVSAENE